MFYLLPAAGACETVTGTALSRVQTDRFQVPATGTGSRLPETGQCVLSSGSRF